MTDDPFKTPEWDAYAKRAMDKLVPKMRDSAVTVSLVPKGETDIKFALELGMCIMLDKPIIAVIQPGTKVPAKLVAVADTIIEGSPNDPDFGERLTEALAQITKDDR